MTTLVIADVDDELLSDLSSLAATNRMATEAQARLLLRQAVPVRNRSALVEKLNAIAAMTPVGAVQPDPVLMLRQDRDR